MTILKKNKTTRFLLLNLYSKLNSVQSPFNIVLVIAISQLHTGPRKVNEHQLLRQLVQAGLVPLRIRQELLDQLGPQLTAVAEQKLRRVVAEDNLKHRLRYVAEPGVGIPLDRVSQQRFDLVVSQLAEGSGQIQGAFCCPPVVRGVDSLLCLLQNLFDNVVALEGLVQQNCQAESLFPLLVLQEIAQLLLP